MTITVRLNNGDTATAEDCEAAMLAARTMWDEAWQAGTLLSRPCVTFRNDETGEEFARTTRRIDLGD